MIRRIIQIVSFALFVFFLGRFVYEHAAGVAIAISPTLHIGNLFRLHKIELIWLIPALAIVLVAFWKGRLFCSHICPLGLVQDIFPSFDRLKSNIRGLNVVILVSIFGASLFFLNLLGIIDPIAIFARIVNVFKRGLFEARIWFVLPFVIILLLNLLRKRFWCYNVCPLGTFVEYAKKLRLQFARLAARPRANKEAAEFDISKRNTLIAFGGGLAAGILLNQTRSAYADPRLIRPPGALPEKLFKETCIRCGNCIRACITDGLQPCSLESGWDGLFSPRLVPRIGECDEYCNRCGISCPTGAIKLLPLSEKRNVRMGRARIDKSKCIAWSQGKLCMICQEYCPYLAIDKVMHNGVPCPVVKEDVCRGCGHCENNCPAPGAAIRVFRLES